MTSAATIIGATEIPVPVAAANAPIADIVVDGLLSYMGHWLKYALDAKLATMGGPTTTGPVTDACPVANRHPYPPRGWWQRGATPALYVWTNEDTPTRLIKDTSLYNRRVRALNIRYIFPELAGPDGQRARAGLLQVVDAVFHRASDLGYHPTYENGQLFLSTVADISRLSWVYEGGAVEYMLAPIPDRSGATGGPSEAVKQHGFPSVLGTITVEERMEDDGFEDPADILGDALFTFLHNEQGDTNDAMEFMQRVGPAPDGSED